MSRDWFKERRASTRREVRWLDLAEAWPEARAYDNTDQAVLEAPPEAVIVALSARVVDQSEVIGEQKTRADIAERSLRELQAAVRKLVACAPSHLFDDLDRLTVEDVCP